ncbi:MAG: VanW family protein, partial [Undibacterium sp.]
MRYASLKISLFLATILFLSGTLFVSAAPLPQVTLSMGAVIEIIPSETVSGWLHITPIEMLDLVSEPVIKKDHLCTKGYQLCDFVQPSENRIEFKSFPFITINDEAVKQSLEALALKADTDPEDAVFGGDENGKIIVIVPEKFGQNLDVTQSFKVLTKALQENKEPIVTVELPTVPVAPAIRGSDAERLGIKELIGSGNTNFKGSPKNRVYNIKRSLEQFQSLIIPAGEEFSFVQYLGEVDEANGYLPELVIRDNKTEPEFGGGVCQVSSTVFRAAIYSGMKITERRNHSYPVQYYLPYGMDATIYIPKPDFKFRNNTGNAIMMQSVIEGTKLTFQFFGTKDGREVSID